MVKYIFLIIYFLCFFCLSIPSHAASSQATLQNIKIENINITTEAVGNLNELQKQINNLHPKNIFIEERLLYQKKNNNILKDLKKIAKKNSSKLFVVVGKNTWIGKRGIDILRLEPNKTNIWQNHELEYKAQMLNHMLDAYSAISKETAKYGKEFVAEFPYWLADFQGPLRTFSQDACLYADRVVLLIDDEDMYEVLGNKWNDLFCHYHISLSKKANSKTNPEIVKLHKKFNNELSFDSYFKGYIFDLDFKG
ncbi:MAG: hypothetical protein HYR97_06340 [Candidatus Melainabacteria bacterium]|nr:hypothetical protein [Candidatus Melainabacteria bacterium]